MKTVKIMMLLTAVAVILPAVCVAQGTGENISSLQKILETLYDTMMPLCEKLTTVSKGIAAFGALWYIAFRVWRHLANAEPIDFYPLFRPFVLGFCIINFPLVLGMINGLMKPTVTGTAEMVKESNNAVKVLLKKKEDALKDSDTWKMFVGLNQQGDRDKWYRYTHDNKDPKKEGVFSAIGNDMRFALSKFAYGIKNQIKVVLSEILQVLFEGAALCINTLRTFQLIVLSILGPLVFGLAVFDGLQQTLSAWLAKYLNIYLWLPVANIFAAIIGKVQEELIKLDIGQIKQTGDTFFSPADTGYIVFLIIGIVGYFTVPSVATFIINGGSGDAMTKKLTDAVSGGLSAAKGEILNPMGKKKK
jgi:conjugative transposon TraJ protein